MPMTATGQRSQNVSRRGVFLLLTCVVLLVFFPCLNAGFLNWDDPGHLTENPDVNAALSLHSVKQIFRHTVNATYVPLTILSFSLEQHFFGLNPAVFHATNIVLHILTSYLVFALASRLGLSLPAALTGAMIFAVHPLHVEPVAWITARKDVLYAVFYLLGLCAYWDFLESRKRRHYFACLLFGFLSVLAKPMALSYPWILLLLDGFRQRQWSWTLVFEKIPFVLFIDGVALVTYALNARAVPLVFPEALLIWLWTATFYVEKFFLPIGLSPLYDLPAPVLLGTTAYLKTMVLVLVFILVTLRLRKNRLLVFAQLFYVGSTFFLWRFDTADAHLVANRFMYLPSLGYCLLLGMLFEQGWKKWPDWRQVLVSGLGMAVLAGWALLSFLQGLIWRDPLTLWNTAIQHAPQQFFAYNNRGMILAAEQPELALKDFNRSLSLKPAQGRVYYNKANALSQLGRYHEALDNYQQALDIDPQDPDYWNNRGLLYAEGFEQYDRAIKDFNQALALNPRYAGAMNNRGSVYYKKGKYHLAIADFQRAQALAPNFVAASHNAREVARILQDRDSNKEQK